MARILSSALLLLALSGAASQERCEGDCALEQDVSLLQTSMQTEAQVNVHTLEEMKSSMKENLFETTTAIPTATGDSAAAVSGITYNTSGDFTVLIEAIITNGIITAVFCLIASILRSLYPTMMTNNAKIGLVKDDPPTDWTSWMWASLAKTREEQKEVAGLDHAMLMEYTVFCIRLCAWIMAPAWLIIAPICYVDGHGDAEASGDTLSMFGINNVKSGHPYLYKIFGVCTLYVVLIAHHEIMRSTKKFLELRAEFLKELATPQARTAMVEGIPDEYQSEAKVREFFSTMFSDEAVAEVNMVLIDSTLTEKYEELKAVTQKLDKANAEWKKAGEGQEARPKLQLGYMSGGEVDAIESYSKEQGELEKQFKVYQESTKTKAASGEGGTNGYIAFVEFANRKDLRVALAMPFTNDPHEWSCSQAFPPADIVWKDLKVSEESKGVKRLIGLTLVFLTYLAFTPFCVWITGIADSINLGPLQSIWETYAPTLGLLIFLSFIPTVLLNIFSSMFNYKTEIRNQEQLQIYYFWFMFFFVILVNVVGANFDEFLEQLLANPMAFPLVLADKMPGTTHYYLNFLCSQWFTHGMNVIRYVQIGKFVGFRKIWEDEEARQLAEPEDQDYYGMGSRSARFTTNMLIVIIFGILSPFMGFMGLVNFFLCRLIYGYLMVYAETKKADGGGAFFVSQMDHTYFGLLIFTILMIGIFSARAPTKIPITCAVLSFFFVIWAWLKFKRMEWVNLPWSQLVFDKTISRKDTGEKYIQPELQEWTAGTDAAAAGAAAAAKK